MFSCFCDFIVQNEEANLNQKQMQMISIEGGWEYVTMYEEVATR